MLHTETVERTTLELLRKLQAEKLLDPFCLAGGTALALYLGHRISVDLDLFIEKHLLNVLIAWGDSSLSNEN